MVIEDVQKMVDEVIHSHGLMKLVEIKQKMVDCIAYRSIVCIALIQIWKIKVFGFLGFSLLGMFNINVYQWQSEAGEGPDCWVEKFGFVVLGNYLKSLNWGVYCMREVCFIDSMYKMNEVRE